MLYECFETFSDHFLRFFRWKSTQYTFLFYYYIIFYLISNGIYTEHNIHITSVESIRVRRAV